MAPRFKIRTAHATGLTAAGWTGSTINFGTPACIVVDYQPDERKADIAVNTVAVSLGDIDIDVDEELGATYGGLWSIRIPVFIDVYGEKQAISVAICDDLRDMFFGQIIPMVDQVTNLSISGANIEIDKVLGPHQPTGSAAMDGFKKFWRIIRVDAILYYAA
jgi:hypothetical protein